MNFKVFVLMVSYSSKPSHHFNVLFKKNIAGAYRGNSRKNKNFFAFMLVVWCVVTPSPLNEVVKISP